MELTLRPKLNLAGYYKAAYKAAEEAVSSKWMISALGMFAALCHIAGWTLVGMTGLAMVFIFVFVSNAKLRGCLPPLCLFMYVISITDGAVGGGNTGGAVFVQYMWYIALLGIGVLVAAFYGIIKRKLFKFRITFGTVGIAAMGLSFSLGGLFATDFELANFETQNAYMFANLAIGLVLAVYFLLFFVALGFIAGELDFEYIAHTMIVASLVVAYQMFHHLFRINAFASGEFNKNLIEIGWGKSNTLAVMIALALPFSAYYMGVSKHPSIAFAILFVQMVSIFVTLSRAMLLISVPFVVGAMVYALIRSQGKARLELTLLSIAISCAAALFILVRWEQFVLLINHYIKVGLTEPEREKMYVDAWQTFLRQPFFGAGYGYKLNVRPSTYFYLVHNTFLQFLMCSGIVGLIAIVVHLFASGMVLFVRPNEKRTFMLIGAVLIFAHSMLDVVWYFPYAQLYYMLFLAKGEHDFIEKTGFGLIWEPKSSRKET